MAAAKIALALSLTVPGLALLADERRKPAVMEQLTEALLAAEHGLDTELAPAVARHAGALAKAAAAIPSLRSKSHRQRGAFERAARRIEALAGEMTEHANRQRLAAARQALEAVRHQCVLCHSARREQLDERETFPAIGNTVWGRLRITTVAGKKREDRSDVVVFLDDVAGKRDAPQRVPSVTQNGRRFEPRVLVIEKGTTVAFPNDDTVFHNVFSRSKTAPFDLGVYGKGKTKQWRFPNTGLVRVYCNIHPDMACSIVVLANPYFAKTDDDGYWAITGIPDGEYLLRIWHRHGGADEHRVSLSDGAIQRIDFAITENRKTVAHRNKFGRPYRRKY